MIIQYIQRMIGNFYNFIWEYSNIVPMRTAIEGVGIIENAYLELPSTYSLPPLRNWRELSISELQFTYKDAHKRSHTLADVSMSIHA